MKSTRRVLSLLLAVIMLFSAFSVVASAKEVEVAETSVTMTGGEILYLKPNSNWTKDGARFACYFFGSGNKWASMEKCPRDSGYYKVEVPSGSWTNVIFCRMNGSTTANDWNNKWNQTGDLVYDGTKNLFTVPSGAWDGSTSGWSTWTETPEPTDPPATEPEATEPEATEPEATEPEATEPEATEPEATEPEAVEYKVYCINSMKWDTVAAYAWTDGGSKNGEWPGVEMTKSEDTVNGFDIYEITLTEEYANIIFNNKNNGSQTEDLELKAENYYDIKADTWYTSLDEVPQVDPLSTDRYLVGGFNGWSTVADEFKLNAEGERTGYVTLTLEAETKYEFKVVREGTWTSCATPITGTVEGLTFSSSVSDNATLTTTVAGEYTFSFGLDSSQLSVTYPEASTEPEATEPEATEPEATEPEIIAEPGYYLVGTLNGADKWTVDADAADRMLKANEGAQGEYMLDYTFVDGDEIKVAYFDGQAITKWFNDGGDNYGIGADKAGKATIYFRPEGNSDWSYFYFTVIPEVVPTEPEATEPEASGDQPATEPEASGDQPATEPEATEPEATEPEATEPEEVGTIKIYFQNNWLWSDVHAYFWGSSDKNSAEWPGDVAKLYANDGKYDVYVAEVPADITAIIFNGTKDDGSGATDQTPDIKDFYDGACYSMTWNDKNDVVVNDIDKIIVPVQPTEPEATEPEVTEPEATEPEATEPEATEPEATEPEATEPEEVGTIKIYFQNNWLWSDVHAYFWGSSDKNSAEWPGDVAELYANDGKYDVYVAEVPADITAIIFNGTKDDGSGATDQTPDIKDFYDGACYSMTWNDKNDVVVNDIDKIIVPVQPTEPEATEPEVPAEKVEKVTGLQASDITRESFTLTWDAIEGAKKYWVYVNGVIYNKTTENTITLENRKVGTDYTVFVTAYIDDYITAVDAAESITVTTLDYEYSYESNADAYNIHLTWDAVDCTKAWVYYGTDADNLRIYNSSKTGELTIPDLESDTTYFVKITYLIDGVIVDDNDVFEVKTAVDEALVITAEVVEDGIAVDWNALEGATKYWVTIETAEKTLVYSTTDDSFVIPNATGDCTISVKAAVNKQMVYFYPVEL